MSIGAKAIPQVDTDRHLARLSAHKWSENRAGDGLFTEIFWACNAREGVAERLAGDVCRTRREVQIDFSGKQFDSDPHGTAATKGSKIERRIR